MSRFYFDCFDGRDFHHDHYGIELDGAAEAADHGATLARELLGEATESVGALAVTVTVRCEAGRPVYTAHSAFHGFTVPDAT